MKATDKLNEVKKLLQSEEILALVQEHFAIDDRSQLTSVEPCECCNAEILYGDLVLDDAGIPMLTMGNSALYAYQLVLAASLLSEHGKALAKPKLTVVHSIKHKE